jgi:hypothetical protein
MADQVVVFRVHTTDGVVDVPAKTPGEARKAVVKANPSVQVTKIKVLK